jgi:enoyl-[acyl-carrier protein] reductase II
VNTPLTELLGIEHPVVLPGMSWISKPELVAAVSGAGGLGILATGPLSPDETRASIEAIRKCTDRPFGIGVTLMTPGAVPNAKVALELEVPVLNFQLGKGEWLIEGVHRYGGKAIPTVTSERHARATVRAGADALLVTGHEAAAHGEDVTSLVLVRAIARAVGIPIIAAGGFADGDGLLAALCLGAHGVAMGTRFAATRESGLHQAMKGVITEKSQTETLSTRNFDGMWARIMKTPTSERVTRRPMRFVETAWRSLRSARAMGLPLAVVVKSLFTQLARIRLLAYFGAAIPLVERATIHGDVERGVQFIGQVQGLVSDVPAAGDLVRRIVAEAEQALERVDSQVRPDLSA